MSEPTNVDAMDHTKKNSSVVGPVAEEATVMLDLANPVCFWNGDEFADGAKVSDGTSTYECSVGKWIKSTN